MEEYQHDRAYAFLSIPVILYLVAEFLLEPAMNRVDFGHGFPPPVFCYRREKKGVGYKRWGG
jgi:hypothetical protein